MIFSSVLKKIHRNKETENNNWVNVDNNILPWRPIDSCRSTKSIGKGGTIRGGIKWQRKWNGYIRRWNNARLNMITPGSFCQSIWLLRVCTFESQSQIIDARRAITPKRITWTANYIDDRDSRWDVRKSRGSLISHWWSIVATRSVK